jgi:hypothetical protein
MKNINKILVVLMVIFLGACSSLKIDTSKNKVELTQLKEPYKVLDDILIRESILPDWYNNETPSAFLTSRQIIKKDGKEQAFLDGLKTKEATPEDLKKFNKLAQNYLGKLERMYKLKDENIKNTKGVVQKLVIGYNVAYPTLEKHLMTDVATEKERKYIQELNVKTEDEMTDKDRKKLRKTLNKWLKRKEFFDAESIYSAQISTETIRLVELSKKSNLTKLEVSNLNAKAMEIAFPELISTLNRWGK